MTMTTLGAVELTAGMTAVTVFSRALFLLPRHAWRLPSRLRLALRFAPAAALAGVVAPELLLAGGNAGPVWIRLGAAGLASGYFLARRQILGTIVCGMLGYWLLRLLA